jgi:hypothetical protein
MRASIFFSLCSWLECGFNDENINWGGDGPQALTPTPVQRALRTHDADEILPVVSIWSLKRNRLTGRGNGLQETLCLF